MKFESILASSAEQLAGLRALLVVTMPDALLYASWTKPGLEFPVDEAAAYFGDLVRANRQGLRVVGSWSEDMQVTIEGSDQLVVLREATEHFVFCAFFERSTPLGMVRLELKMLLEQLQPELPKVQSEEIPRGVRLMQFIERYAPDPHMVMLRLATRTGVPIDTLNDPAKLTDEQVDAIEQAARRILGLDHINV